MHLRLKQYLPEDKKQPERQFFFDILYKLKPDYIKS